MEFLAPIIEPLVSLFEERPGVALMIVGALPIVHKTWKTADRSTRYTLKDLRKYPLELLVVIACSALFLVGLAVALGLHSLPEHP